MEQFNRFYLWGVDTKYRMGLYFSAAVFFKGLVNVLLRSWTVEILILLEMLLACFVFACLESAIFPYVKEWPDEGRGRRVALWAALANLIFIGCAWGLHWFPGAPQMGRTSADCLSGVGAGSHVVRLEAEKKAGHRRTEPGSAPVSKRGGIKWTLPIDNPPES